MNVSLTPQLQELVKRKVANGMYNSASEVVREALRLLEARDETQTAKLAALRDYVQNGLDSGAATPMSDDDWEAIKKRGRTRLKQAGDTEA